MDEGGETGLGAILADMGANLVTVLLILLALSLALQGAGRQAVRDYPVQVVPTLSGRAQSDLLFQRLSPPPDTLVVEVTREGVVWIDDGRPRPLADRPAAPMPSRAVVFVLSPAHYGALRDVAVGLPADRTEMTVPQALQRPDGGGFSDAFLAIRPGSEPASIRPELRRLLLQGGLGRTAADAATGGAAERAGLFTRLGALLRLVGNLTLLAVTLLILRRLWRRWRVTL